MGHAVLALPHDAAAVEAKKALLGEGFADADLLSFTSAELFPDLSEMMRNASGAAGFGYEIVLMRRYMKLASEGCGWLVVYSPEKELTAKVGLIAQEFAARSAVHYGRLASEDLL